MILIFFNCYNSNSPICMLQLCFLDSVNPLPVSKNRIFDDYLFFHARKWLNLLFSFASMLSRSHCQHSPIIIHLSKRFHFISPKCTLLELQNKPIDSLVLDSIFYRLLSPLQNMWIDYI